MPFPQTHTQEVVARPDRFLEVTAAATLTPEQQVVGVIINGASYTLKLPPVSKCQGREYAILVDVQTAHVLTISDFGDEALFTDIVLDTDNDSVVLRSTGTRWVIVEDNRALGPVDITAATITITKALHANRIITLSLAAGIIVTMPEPTGTGDVYEFRVLIKFTGDTTFVLPDLVNTSLVGGANIADSAAPTLGEIFTPGATHDLVTLDGTNTGGGLGCVCRFTDLKTDVWGIDIIESVGGTAPATPFSST